MLKRPAICLSHVAGGLLGDSGGVPVTLPPPGTVMVEPDLAPAPSAILQTGSDSPVPFSASPQVCASLVLTAESGTNGIGEAPTMYANSLWLPSGIVAKEVISKAWEPVPARFSWPLTAS